MTNKATTIAVIILAIIIWLFFQNNQEQIKPINTVSLQTNTITEIPRKKPKIKVKVAQVEADIQTDEIINQPATNNTLKELSYMQLYDKSLIAKDCYDLYIISAIKKEGLSNKSKQHEIDYLQRFKDRINSSSNGRQQKATQPQIEAYQGYIEECLALKNESKNSSDTSDTEKGSYHFIIEHIHTAMQKTKPMTDEGIQLKKALKEVKDFDETINLIKQTNTGESDLSDQEFNQLKNEIYGIKRKLKSSDFFADEAKLSDEYIALKKELDDKQDYLNLHLNIDQSKLAQQKDILINSIIKLESQLKTQYPSVFLEVFNALNFSQSSANNLPSPHRLNNMVKVGLQIPFISQHIFEQSGINDKDYFNQLLQPSLDLYQCYLGADCTFQNNRRSAYLCYIPIGRYQQSSSKLIYEACEMNLDDFYFQVFLTENQVEDMNVIFNYLVNNYAN